MTYPDNLGEGKHPLTAENELQSLLARAADTAGDQDGATAWRRQAARRQGDTSAALDEADHWRALALRDLGQEEAALAIHRELLTEGRQRVREGDRVDYFATSLPDFLVFQRPEPGRGQVTGTYLVGLAQLGMRDVAAATRTFRRALTLAVDHIESALRLAELAEADRTVDDPRTPGQAARGPAPATAPATHSRGSRPVRAG